MRSAMAIGDPQSTSDRSAMMELILRAPPAIIAPRALPLLPPLLRAWSFSFCLEGCLPTSRCAALPAAPHSRAARAIVLFFSRAIMNSSSS